jgi:hypothetical protein
MSIKNKRDEIAAGIVAGSAFIASATHIVTVAVEAGNFVAVAAVHAIGIDGLIYIGIRAMQRGNKRAGIAALLYGAAVSLVFNAASYGAFEMPKIVIAFTMPVAMLLAFLVVHSGHGTKDSTRDSAEDTEATRTHVHLDIQRDTVRTPRPHTTVQATTVQPETSTPVTGTVVQPERKAITRRPAARDWDRDRAIEMLATGTLTHAQIAAEVGASTKSIQRLRKALTEGSTE